MNAKNLCWKEKSVRRNVAQKGKWWEHARESARLELFETQPLNEHNWRTKEETFPYNVKTTRGSYVKANVALRPAVQTSLVLCSRRVILYRMRFNISGRVSKARFGRNLFEKSQWSSRRSPGISKTQDRSTLHTPLTSLGILPVTSPSPVETFLLRFRWRWYSFFFMKL